MPVSVVQQRAANCDLVLIEVVFFFSTRFLHCTEVMIIIVRLESIDQFFEWLRGPF